MNKQQWIKLCAAGVATIGLTVYASGLFAGKELIYEIRSKKPLTSRLTEAVSAIP